MNYLRIFFLLALIPCWGYSENLKNTELTENDLSLLLVYLTDADQVHKEISPIYSRNKKKSGSTPFFLFKKAFEKNFLKNKNHLKTKNEFKFGCEKFNFNPIKGFENSNTVEIQEVCSKTGKHLGEIKKISSYQYEFKFLPSQMTQILGMGASVFSNDVFCILKGNDKNLISFSCENWIETGSATNQVYRFKNYKYQKNIDPIIDIQGEMLENVFPQRKVSLIVPLTGKIRFSEIETYPPEGYTNEVLKPKIKDDSVEFPNENSIQRSELKSKTPQKLFTENAGPGVPPNSKFKSQNVDGNQEGSINGALMKKEKVGPGNSYIPPELLKQNSERNGENDPETAPEESESSDSVESMESSEVPTGSDAIPQFESPEVTSEESKIVAPPAENRVRRSR